jgi:hypothetical protein
MKGKSITSILLGMVIFSACMQEPESADLVKYMVVQTQYNPTYVNNNSNIFEAFSTFVIREDTMGFVSTRNSKKYIIESDIQGGNFVIPTVDSIRDGFISKGYSQVTDNDNPDFAVNVVVLDNFSYYQTINYGGFGYPGSYYGYYGYYYPVVTTHYSSYVTLLIQVVSTTKVGNEYPIIWSAYIGDLSATLDLRGKTLEAVSTAFEQSQYINKN